MLKLPDPLIHRLTLHEGFTQSELSDMSCMQRWNFRYNQRLVRQGVHSWALDVGTAFHDAMEQFYATEGKRVSVATLQLPENYIPTMQDHIDLEYWNKVLPRMVEAYAIYYKNDPSKMKVETIEEELDFVYRGFRLRGKVDLQFLDDDGRWIMDHKTSARLSKDIVAAWDFRMQFMFYLWLKWISEKRELRYKGFYINGVKKPELRVKKTESLDGFAQRVFEDMIQEPDKYFYRSRMPLTKDALQYFETTVIDPKIEILDFVVKNPTSPLANAIITNKNTEECQKYGGMQCAYLDLCKHGPKMDFLYDVREQKHMELEAEPVGA